MKQGRRCRKKVISAVLCMALLVGTFSLTGCGGSSDVSAGGKYSIWLYSAQDSEYYKDYADNPMLQYLLAQEEWSNIELEFDVPAAGTAQDNYTTLITSGDFPTLMQNSVSDTAPVMYDNGYIIDLTELVEEYMPNYYALIMSNEDLYKDVVYEIDGEEKILVIATVQEDVDYYFCGYVYRRDWIVKYGTNPSTGEAFTGGYTDEDDVDSWEDDVLFPSWYDDEKRTWYQENCDEDWDGTTPAYISDWEWMFEIFEVAMEDLGIDDGYCTSMYYTGYTWSGGLCSCFGEGALTWYYASGGTVKFGGTEDSTYAYLTCMNNWYENGWLDDEFYTRTSDMFYSIDSTTVRQGKVGMWTGLESDLGGRLDLADGGYTDGIYVEGCAYPVNDTYGTSDNQYVVPRVTQVSSTVVSTGFYVMDGKNTDLDTLPALLEFLDYFYTEEGSLLHTLGLSQEQYEECEDQSIYKEYGLEEGTYTVGDDGRYVRNSVISEDSGGLELAVSLQSLPGYELVSSVDKGYADTYEASLDTWILFENHGLINGSTAMAQVTTDESDTFNSVQTKVLDYLERNAYKYIIGETELNDSTWEEWCDGLNAFDIDEICDILQPYVDQYPL